MSIDGRGSIQRQVACIKAVEKAGRIELAERMLLSLVKDFPVNTYPPFRLSELARIGGDFNLSMMYINNSLAAIEQSGLKYGVTDLKLERIRTIVAMGNLNQAMVELNELDSETRAGPLGQAKSGNARTSFWATLSHMALIRGFIEDERGQSEQAIKTWRQGYLETRQAIGIIDAASSLLIVNVLILGSLSNELAPSDATGMVVALSGSAMPQQLVRMGVGQFGEDVVHQSLLKMWQRPEAKQLARDGFALHRLSYQERLSIPIELAGREFVRQTAFADELADGQNEVIRLAIADLVSLIETKKFGMLDLMGAGLAWKTPDAEGKSFESLVNRLPDRSKSYAAYIIAHRLVKSGGNLTAVQRWLQTALAAANEDELISAEIRDELAELKSNHGLLRITNPLGREIEIELTRADGKSQVQKLSRTREWKLTSGDYQARVIEGQSAKLSSETFSIRPLAPQNLQLESVWAPGSEESAWPGPIARPAKIPGIQKWQIFHRQPLTSLKIMSGSPDGRFLAVAGRDGLVRVYHSDSLELAHLLPGHADVLTCLSWSDDGRFLLTTAYYSVQLWQFPEAKLVSSFAPASFATAALSPDGNRIALGGWTGTIQGVDRHGVLKQHYKSHPDQITDVKWTADGSAIISTGVGGKLSVSNVNQPAKLLDRDFGSRLAIDLSPDHTRLAVTQANKGTIEFIDTTTWKTTRTLQTQLSNVQAVTWLEASKQVAIVSSIGELNIFDATSSNTEPKCQTKSKPSFRLARFGHNRLAAVDYEGIEVWDSELTKAASGLAAMNVGVVAIEWRPDHDHVTIAFSRGRLRFFDSAGEQVAEPLQGSTPRSIAWSDGGERLAAGFWSGEVIVFQDDLATKKSLAFHASAASVAWTRDGKLLTGNGDGELREYADIDKPHRVVTKIQGPFLDPVEVDAGLLLFTSGNSSFHLVDLAGSGEIRSSDRKSLILGVASDSTSGKVAVTVGSKVEIFNASHWTGKNVEPTDTWQFGSAYFRDVAWSANGKTLYVPHDGMVSKFNEIGEVLESFSVQKQLSPEHFAVSSNEKVAVSGTASPFATFYDLTENQAVFSIVLLQDDRVFKFYPGGYCTESLDDVDEELVCVIMDDDGVVRMQPPSEFFKR